MATTTLPQLKDELATPSAAGYDMTESFITAMREFVLAEAQECFWQQAVLRAFRPVSCFRPFISNIQRGATRTG